MATPYYSKFETDSKIESKVKDTIKSNESLSLAQRKGDVLFGILDQYTGEEITLSKVTGTPIVDNIIYFKLGSEYFKRNFDLVNVKWFGAKGDNVTDDYNAIINGIAFCNSNNYALYFPKGAFVTFSTITISQGNIHLIGDSYGTTYITHKPTVVDTDMLVFEHLGTGYVSHNSIKNIELVGDTIKTRRTLSVIRQTKFSFVDGSSYHGKESIYVDYCQISKMDNVKAQSSFSASNGGASLSIAANATTTFEFNNCWFEGLGDGILQKGGSAWFKHCTIQSNGRYGANIKTVGADPCSSSFISCHFEGNADSAISSTKISGAGFSADNILVEDCNLLGPSIGSVPVLIDCGFVNITLKNFTTSRFTKAIRTTSDTFRSLDYVGVLMETPWNNPNIGADSNLTDPQDLIRGYKETYIRKERSFAQRDRKATATGDYTPNLAEGGVHAINVVNTATPGQVISTPTNYTMGSMLRLIFTNSCSGIGWIKFDDLYITDLRRISPYKTMSVDFTYQSQIQIIRFTGKTGSWGNNYATVTGSTSGATALITREVLNDGSTTDGHLIISNVLGTFQSGETITSTATATLTSENLNAWVELGGSNVSYLTGTADPIATNVPVDFIGQDYLNTSTNLWYKACGRAVGEWKCITQSGDDTGSINNGTVLQTANFNINGNGKIGGVFTFDKADTDVIYSEGAAFFGKTFTSFRNGIDHSFNIDHYNDGSPINAFKSLQSGEAVFPASVAVNQFKLKALNTAPTSATDTGVLGEIRYDANYMYVCTATNTWKRSALTTW